MQLLTLQISADYYIHPPGIISLLMLTITYIQATPLHVHHTQGRFNNHSAHSLYRIMVMATSVMDVMKMENIVPRVGLEPTSLVFQASLLPFHHISSLTSLLYPRPPVYAAPCLRGQCRLLHSSPWNYKSFNAYNYIHTGNALTCTSYTG